MNQFSSSRWWLYVAGLFCAVLGGLSLAKGLYLAAAVLVIVALALFALRARRQGWP